MESFSHEAWNSAPAFQDAEWEDWLRWDPATEPMSGATSSKSSIESPAPLTALDDESVSWPASALNDTTPKIADMDSALPLHTEAKMDVAPFDFSLAPTIDPFLFDQDVPSVPQVGYDMAGPGIGQELLDETLAAPQLTHTIAKSVPEVLILASASTSPKRAVDSHQTSPVPTEASTIPSDTTSATRKNASKKRKSIAQPAAGDLEPPQKKTSHNVIEKRYRNNLNDKIQELRDCVPSLRAMSRPDASETSEDLGGLTAAHKLNKSTVMSKATEYIRHLESRNKTMVDEMTELKARLTALEDATDTVSRLQALTPDDINLSRSQASDASDVHVMQQAMSGIPHHAKSPKANSRRANTMGKLMVGAMAGMMAVEGLHDGDISGGEGGGLAAVPMQLMRRGLNDHHTSQLSTHQLAFALLKIFFILGAFVYLIMPLFARKAPRKMVRVASRPSISGKTSLASPVEMRRKAWLTAIQSVWTPRPFVVEAILVTVRMVELSLRRMVGFDNYAKLLGMSKEDEAARIKTWDIAIDAQLAGGDAEVNHHRLLLTIMASGTLPDSPTRLMQKAVHFSIFFWEVANAGYGNFFMFRALTARVAKAYWNSARTQQKAVVSGKASRQDELNTNIDLLPDHLAALVELECDDVLTDAIIQRAYNLAWNRPSAEDTQSRTTLDSVVEDQAVRSPLDAVAAWFTNLIIDEALAILIHDDGVIAEAETLLHLAVTTAPPASATLTRALVARAALIADAREASIHAALAVAPTKSHGTTQTVASTIPMNLVEYVPLTPDMRTGLTFAKLLSIASGDNPSTSQIHAATSLSAVSVNLSDMTLLTAVTAVKVIDTFANNALLYSYGKTGLESLAASLTLWLRSSACRRLGLEKDQREQISDRCLLVTERMGDCHDKEELDSGYASCGRSRRLSDEASSI